MIAISECFGQMLRTNDVLIHAIQIDKELAIMKTAKRVSMSGATVPKKKVTVDIPVTLNDRTEAVLQERHTSFSVIVREALETYVSGYERRKLEKNLREGCIANAELDLEIGREFEAIDAEATA